VGDPCVVFVVLNSVVGYVGNCSLWLCVVLSAILFCFFSALSGRRCILVTWCVKAAVLCYKGWLDSKFMVVSVVVGSVYVYFEMCGFSVYVQVKKVCFHFLFVSG
jgi:hypothetical protein